MIDVQNPHYHGHIEGTDVYINENQPELDWLETALHECIHSDFDYGNLSDGTNFQVRIAERFARSQAKRELKVMFNKKSLAN